MGLFSKLVGMPEADPSGRSREYFELVAKTAMKMAIRGDLPRAVKHMEIMIMKAADKYNRYHPDIGRARLAKAAIFYLSGDLEEAHTEVDSALIILGAYPEICEFDIQAAKDFSDILDTAEKQLSGASEKEPNLYGRPFGAWVSRLES